MCIINNYQQKYSEVATTGYPPTNHINHSLYGPNFSINYASKSGDSVEASVEDFDLVQRNICRLLLTSLQWKETERYSTKRDS